MGISGSVLNWVWFVSTAFGVSPGSHQQVSLFPIAGFEACTSGATEHCGLVPSPASPAGRRARCVGTRKSEGLLTRSSRIAEGRYGSAPRVTNPPGGDSAPFEVRASNAPGRTGGLAAALVLCI